MDFEEFREKLKGDLAERLFDRTGDDFEITSSSVNKLQNAGYEGISVRKEGEAVENMVKEVNATQVDLKDQLSDHVYHYDAKEKVFELAEKFDARKKEKAAEKHAEKDSVLKDLSAEKKEVADAPKIKADKAAKKDTVVL